jgi:hypothetical protein
MHAEAEIELVKKKAKAGPIGLKPLAIEDELGNGAFANVLDDLGGSARDGFDIHFGKLNLVLIEVALHFTAVLAPWGRVEEHSHRGILAANAVFWTGLPFRRLPSRLYGFMAGGQTGLT